MIPVTRHDEPDNFHELVTKKAQAFIEKIPQLKKKDIDRRPLWRNALDDLYESYGEICAYCGLWFHRDAVSVDHFTPISEIWRTNPMAAYEWNNFRLASRSMNTEKGDYVDVVDPFKIKKAWFIIAFPTMIIKSGADLSPADKEKVDATIQRLKLNDFEKRYIRYRRKLILNYCEMVVKWGSFESALAHLKRMAPFIAFELKRQGLTEQIVERLKSPKRQQRDSTG